MVDSLMPDRWYYTLHGKDYGPVSWAVIESMVQEDRLSRDDLVVREGATNHQRIAEVETQRPGTLEPSPRLEEDHVEMPESEPKPMAQGTDLAPSTDDESLLPSWTKPPEWTIAAEDVGEYGLEPSQDVAAAEFTYESPPAQKPIAPSRPRPPKVMPREDQEESTETDRQYGQFFSAPRLIFAMELNIVCSLAAVICIILGSQFGSPDSPFVMFLLTCVALIEYNILAVTVSQMQSQEMASKKVFASEGWQYAMERLVPLIFGPLFVAFAVGSVLAIGGTIVHSLSHLSSIGPFLGSILLIPTFLVIVGTLVLALAGSILPVIMGVENCSPEESRGIWTDQMKQRPVRAVLDILRVWSSILPMLLILFTLIFVSLGIAVPLTSDWGGLIEVNFNLTSLLNIGSLCVILGSGYALAILLGTSGLTVLYVDDVD